MAKLTVAHETYRKQQVRDCVKSRSRHNEETLERCLNALLRVQSSEPTNAHRIC